jgi:uncharacterized membrane protein YbhN (UPF0104 family)
LASTVKLPLSDLVSFTNAVGKFFSNLASLRWGSLIIGLLLFGIYLSFRARAWFNVLRAAYPAERIQFRRIWGAYMAAYGFNNVVPARGGEIIKLFLAKTSIPNSSYPAIVSSLSVEVVFDVVVGVFILVFAFAHGVFPKPPDFSKLGAFELSFLFAHPRFTLFLITALAVLVLVGFALLSARVKAFWARVRQGVTILFDRRRYLRQVFLVQLAGYVIRFAAFWNILDAFRIGGSFENVALVLAVNAVASAVPFTPGGAGVQQALLLKVFASKETALVTAYSVGQQIAIAAFSFTIGFLAIVFVFRFRGFRDVIAAGRAHRAAADSP